MKTPSSLMITRSVADELPGEAIVRPAIQVSSWNPPLTAMSQCTSPLGPQAAQAMRASSTSVSGTGSCSERNCSGLSPCTTVLPDEVRSSGLPLSTE